MRTTVLSILLSGCVPAQEPCHPQTVAEACAHRECPAALQDILARSSAFPLVFHDGTATVAGWMTGHSGYFFHFDGDELVGYRHRSDIRRSGCSGSYVVGTEVIPFRKLNLPDWGPYQHKLGYLSACTFEEEWKNPRGEPPRCEKGLLGHSVGRPPNQQ